MADQSSHSTTRTMPMLGAPHLSTKPPTALMEWIDGNHQKVHAMAGLNSDTEPNSIKSGPPELVEYKRQVVAGTNHHLFLKYPGGKKPKMVKAVVWQKLDNQWVLTEAKQVDMENDMTNAEAADHKSST